MFTPLMTHKIYVWALCYPLLSYFSWLCAWDVCYIIFCHLSQIHSGKTRILFSLLLCSLWWLQIVVLACRSYSFVCTLHHVIKIIVCYLSEDITLIKCLSNIFCRVWVRLSTISQLSILQYMGLCVFNLPISLVTIKRIYILCLIIIIKLKVWSIIHCLGLGHGTMICVVCLSLYILM